MLPISLKNLTPDHIQGLIESEVGEGLTLEYKQQLPTEQSESKRKFLYSVAAMANSQGGDIVFGIVDGTGPDKQSTGIPEKLSGMKIPNVQKAIEFLSNSIRNCIEPRLNGITTRVVNCPEGDVLVVRIPPSWLKPHMVTMGGVNRFCTRTAIGVSPMSLDEIGRAFSAQSELGEIIERWRTHRAELIAKGKGPAQLTSPVTFLLHVIPADSFTRQVLSETWSASKEERDHMYVPMGAYGFRYNADGFLCHSQFNPGGPTVSGYTQLFRSGIVEYADSHCFWAMKFGGRSVPVIQGQEIEKQMVYCYQDTVKRFRRLESTGPVYVGFSLVGIEGKPFFSTPTSTELGLSSTEDIFISPEVLVDPNESEDQPFERTLLPLVDTMWQVAGKAGTPFKFEGRWDPFGQYY